MRRSPGPPTAVEQLKRALRARKVYLDPEPRAQLALLDAVYRFRYGVVGVQVCETWEKLEGTWRGAQHELGSLARAHRLAWGLGNDVYLLFLLSQTALTSIDSEKRVALLREIEASPSECLKEVVPLTKEWQQELEDLTFMPLDEPPTVPDRASTAVAELLQAMGFPSDLADELTRRRGPSAGTVVQRLGDECYGEPPTVAAPAGIVPSTHPKVDAKSSRRRAAGTSQRVQLERLTLRNFRSFCTRDRGPVEIDLSGDLILIYGGNATGKTCLAQAIEWVICGDVKSLSETVAREDIGECAHLPVRSMWADGQRDQSVEVHLDLSGGTPLHGIEGPDGTRSFTDSLVAEAEILEELLGIGREPYERPESLRDRASANLVLLQHQMSRLLSARPDERLGQFATLLGESGIPRTEGRLADIARELRRRSAELDREEVAIRQREEAARAERTRISVELASETKGIETAPTPEQYLEAARASGPAVSGSILDTPGQVQSGEATGVAVHRVVERLDERRAFLVGCLERAKRMDECSGRLELARAEFARSERTLDKARTEHADVAARAAEIQQALERLDEETTGLRKRQQQFVERRHALEQWFELGPLIRRRRERLSAIVQRAAVLRSEVEKLDKEVNVRSTALQSAQGSLGAVGPRRDQAQGSVQRLQEIADILRQHGQLGAQLPQLEAERREATASAGACQEQLARAVRQRDNAAAVVSSTEVRLSQLRGRREDRDRLLQSLREHIDSNDCPLCSHRYESREHLLAAIEHRIGSPSVDEQSLMSQLKREKRCLPNASSS